MPGKAISYLFGAAAALAILAGVVGLLIFFVYALKITAPELPNDEPVAAEEPATAKAATRTTDLPPIPLEMNVPARHLSDQGYIVQFHNSSDKVIRVVFDLESGSSHTSKVEAIEIPAQATIELGWDRGWKFGAGDRVLVSCDGFKGAAWTMPQ